MLKEYVYFEKRVAELGIYYFKNISCNIFVLK